MNSALAALPTHFSGHRLQYDSAYSSWVVWPDPGNAGVIAPSSPGAFGHMPLVIGTTAETRTLPDPERPGLELVITVKSIGGGGSCVVTGSTKIDTIGDTKLTFNAVDQVAYLISVPYNGNTNKTRWEVLEADQALLGPGLNYGGTKRLTAQSSASGTTTLAQISDLTFSNLIVGQWYAFNASLMMTSSSTTGGVQLAVNGTATATSVGYQLNITDTVNKAYGVTIQGTALGSSATTSGAANATKFNAYIDGVIQVGASGTLGVQFAQSNANGTSYVNIGSYISLTPVA